MKRNVNKLSLICLIICSVLCVALIVTQFLPFWNADVEILGETGEFVSENKDFSVWDYLSFPEHEAQEQLGKYLQKTVGKDNFDLNGLAGTACLILAFGVLTVIFTILKYDKTWTFIFPLVCGIGAVVGYLTEAPYKLGQMWLVSLIIGALITVSALLAGIGFFISVKKWFVDDDIV